VDELVDGLGAALGGLAARLDAALGDLGSTIANVLNNISQLVTSVPGRIVFDTAAQSGFNLGLGALGNPGPVSGADVSQAVVFGGLGALGGGLFRGGKAASAVSGKGTTDVGASADAAQSAVGRNTGADPSLTVGSTGGVAGVGAPVVLSRPAPTVS